jgi:hypothetical protein
VCRRQPYIHDPRILPVISRSYAATCRSPAGENGRHLLSIWSGITGEPASPVGDSSALIAATDRRSQSAGDDLCPAVGSAYGWQYLLPLLCALAANNYFGSAPPVAGLQYRRHCGRRTVGGSHECVRQSRPVVLNWPHSLYTPGASFPENVKIYDFGNDAPDIV